MTSAGFQLAARRANAQLAAFGAWWFQELRDAWFELVERVAPQRSQQFILDLSADRATLGKAGSGQSNQVLEFAAPEASDLPALQEIWPQGAPQQARVAVILPEASMLLCHLRLPPVSEGEVPRVVELQLERQLPLPREQLYIDWKVQEKKPDQSRIVAVAIARRSYIDRIRDAVGSWGWRAVSMSGRVIEGEPRFNLLPPPVHRLSFEIGRREQYLSASALALGAAYMLVVAGQWWYERSSLDESLEHARAQMSSINKQRALLSTAGKPIESLRDLMQTQSADQALVAMSAVIPADSWVYQTDIRTSTSGPVVLALEGYTPAATALLETLEKSAQLENVELIEAASAGLGTGLDRVELKARLHAGVQR